VIAGRKGPQRDVVLLNAGASLFVGGTAASVSEGIERAAQAIDSGAARTTLAAMVEASHASLSDTSRQGGDRARAGAQQPGGGV
jgi:anthranilate phosphoribosyltransferase